jgi:hypothetical protein
MSSQFANVSLYIPHVFANISKKRIAETFEHLRIGSVKRIDFINKKGSSDEYNTVYIHFNYWYDNIAARNFQERVLNPNMEARIVYDEPWFWIVLENKGKKASGAERKPRVNFEALNKSESGSATKQMTNQDFAKLVNEASCHEDEADFRALCEDISKEVNYFGEDVAIDTLDQVLEESRNLKEENRILKEQIGKYMAMEGKAAHEHNMLMDDYISVKNQLALLKEEQMFNNV